MDLKTAVEKYLQIVKEFSRPMPLAQLGLSKDELEAMLSAWDEDYALHRHFELIPPSIAPSHVSADAALLPSVYLVGGLPYSAIVFKESIRNVLE